LSELSLSRAHLRGANLAQANLRDTSLYGADLRDSDLSGADMSTARLEAPNNRSAASRWRLKLTGARYDARTRWPADFDPVKHGAILVK
jgi:uncharacterized protein YjbI with pentapeptide repeats